MINKGESMAANNSTGVQPAPFERNETFVSPSIRNILSDKVHQQKGIKFTTYKTFLPSKFDPFYLQS